VLRAQGDAHRARLFVRDAPSVEVFAALYDADIETRPLTLEQIFPLLTGRVPADGSGRESGATQFAHFLRLIAYLAAVTFFHVVIAGGEAATGDRERMAKQVAGIAVVVQLLHALHLHHHYTKRDLVPGRR
jgi:hypothetical protein